MSFKCFQCCKEQLEKSIKSSQVLCEAEWWHIKLKFFIQKPFLRRHNTPAKVNQRHTTKFSLHFYDPYRTHKCLSTAVVYSIYIQYTEQGRSDGETFAKEISSFSFGKFRNSFFTWISFKFHLSFSFSLVGIFSRWSWNLIKARTFLKLDREHFARTRSFHSCYSFALTEQHTGVRRDNVELENVSVKTAHTW